MPCLPTVLKSMTLLSSRVFIPTLIYLLASLASLVASSRWSPPLSPPLSRSSPPLSQSTPLSSSSPKSMAREASSSWKGRLGVDLDNTKSLRMFNSTYFWVQLYIMSWGWMTWAWISMMLSLLILLMNFNIYLLTYWLLLATHCTLNMLSLITKNARFPFPLILLTLPRIHIFFSFKLKSTSLILCKIYSLPKDPYMSYSP